MSRRRRNTRRHRRDPARRPVHIPQRVVAGFDQPETVPVAEDLWLPGAEHYLLNLWLGPPDEQTPLYAMLAAVYHAIAGRASQPRIIVSAQLARGIEYLGFEAALLPACARVFRLNRGRDEIAEVGAWDAVSVYGEAEGHLVVWTASFNQCIDLAMCQDDALVSASTDGQLMLPAVLPMPGGLAQLLYKTASVGAEAIGVERPPFRITWNFFPERMGQFDPLLADYTDVIERGGLSLAHVVLDLLSALAVHHDMHQLNSLHSHLSRLLSGDVRLPELDNYSSRCESGMNRTTEFPEARRDNFWLS